jgi:hypothetical protein
VANSTQCVTPKRDARNALHSIPCHIAQQVQQFVDEHLSHHPTQHIPAKLKRFKGQLASVWQYELPLAYRLWYRVDE